MGNFQRLAHAGAICVVAAGLGIGAGVATAYPSPSPHPPTPGGPNAPTHGSLVDQPSADGNSGSGYLPHAEGAQCQNSWVVCGGYNNPPHSNLGPSRRDQGGWVNSPMGTGMECQNPGVVCTDVG